MRLYGLTVADYDDLVAAQDGRCRICGEPPARGRLVIDHDHETGRMRGLLCDECNTVLGLADDNPGRLRAAAEYVEAAVEQAQEAAS